MCVRTVVRRRERSGALPARCRGLCSKAWHPQVRGSFRRRASSERCDVSQPSFVRRRSTSRRLLSGGGRAVGRLALAAYLIVATGLPLPTFATPTLAGQRFPCEHGRCGCATAEQCWKSCCCHTNRERLEWARAHGVIPPSYVFAAAQDEVAAEERTGCKPGSGCSQPAKRACCRTPAAALESAPLRSTSSSSAQATTAAASTAAATSTRPASCCAAASTARPVATPPASRVVWISFLASQRCRGSAPFWANGPVSLTPPAPPRPTFAAPRIQPCLLPAAPCWASASFAPPVPPPRCS